ncbi:MAG: O-antigen ligase family protein, partial [Myxococcales bacterium]|nr:O-antigen ligase family protein [Myxococcales bacterium]
MTSSRRWPEGLATWSVGGGAFVVLLLYAPALQAPFLVPKFAALEIAAALGLAAFAFHRVLAGGQRWSGWLAAGAWLVLITSGVSWLAAFGLPYGSAYAVPALLRWGALFGVACGASVLHGRPAAGRALEAVTLAAGIVAVIGLLQHLEALPFAIPVFSLPGSTFGNRNLAGEVIAMALPLGVGVALADEPGRSRALLWASLAIELCYLGVTRARGAWAGAATGVALALWLVRPRPSRRAVALALGVLAAVVLMAARPGRFNPRHMADAKRYSAVVDVIEDGLDPRSTALQTRLGMWRRTLTMIAEHPVFGVGPGNWPVVFPKYAEPGAMSDGVLSASLAPRQAHDDALERTAETGIVGAAAFAFLLVAVVVAARRRNAEAEPTGLRAMTAGAIGALAALAAISVVGFPLEMPGTLMLAGIALGLLAPRSGPRVCSTPSSDRAPPIARLATVALGTVALLACAVVRTERQVRHSYW